MDSKQSRNHFIRSSPETTSRDDRQPIRHYSSTLPGTSSANLNSRSVSLSSQVKDYYEKLVSSSKSLKSNLRSDRGFIPEQLCHSYGGETLECQSHLDNMLSRNSDPLPSSGGLQKEGHREIRNQHIQPHSTSTESRSEASGSYNRRKTSPLLSPVFVSSLSQPYFEKANVDSKSRRSRSKSPLDLQDVSHTRCTLCQDSSHSPRSCSARNRTPADQEATPLSQRVSAQGGLKSFSDGRDRSFPDFHGITDSNPIVAQKKAVLPPGLTIRRERDVIGQERSPVSKIQPSLSGVLSTSSSNFDSVPRERKKWVRPPLVGQAASASDQPLLINSSVFGPTEDNICLMGRKRLNIESSQLSSSTGSEQTESKSGSRGISQQDSSYYDSSSDTAKRLVRCREEFLSEKGKDESSAANFNQPNISESDQGLSDSCPGGRASPSSSVTSSRRLEWDSGADVGYNQDYQVAGLELEALEVGGLCAIERMALAQGCSLALRLRLDPEGTTVPVPAAGAGTSVPPPVLPSPVQDVSSQRAIGIPTAESTPIERVLQVGGLSRRRNEPQIGISPILPLQYQDFNREFCRQNVNKHVPLVEDDDEEQDEVEKEPLIHPVSRHFSHSMQDLSKQNNEAKDQLCRSQSDPDLSAADTSTLMPTCSRLKLQSIQEICRSKHLTESGAAGHSVSSGSDATLIHIEQEDEQEQRENKKTHSRRVIVSEEVKVPNQAWVKSSEECRKSSSATQQVASAVEKMPKEQVCSEPNGPDQAEEPEDAKLCNQHNGEASNPSPSLQQAKSTVTGQSLPSQLSHLCSDKDHLKGLHHHFGVLCSSAVGGHVTSPVQPGSTSQMQRDCVNRLNPVMENQKDQQEGMKSHNRVHASSSGMAECELLTAESAGSSAFQSDAAQDEHAASGNTLLMTGRANSFEYLPGHMYQSRSAGRGKQVNQGPPGISTSTETDSEPVRSLSHAIHHSVTDSSSRETEEDRLWGSPRAGSNSLVRDLERGISLLKGIMESKSSSRQCKRDVIRRVIRRLVTSEYVEDLMVRDKPKLSARSPFSPKRAKQSEWQERPSRSRKGSGQFRQEVLEESEEQKKHTHNVRKKLHNPSSSIAYRPQRIQKTCNESKSSSLWSSQLESTSGSLSISGASEPSKGGKHSVDPSSRANHVMDRKKTRSDWMEPATKSERMFAMRMQSNGKVPTIEPPVQSEEQETALIVKDPVSGFLRAEHSKQLFWVKNEINHLKILKQLLQKQETLKKGIEPHPLYHSTYTVMPLITSQDKHTMRMADCVSSDVAEEFPPTAHKPQWKDLESDTSGPSATHDWQEVELTSTNEMAARGHQSVNISDNDHGTESSNSANQCCCNKKTEKVSDDRVECICSSDEMVSKKRSDCVCGNSEDQPLNAVVAPPNANRNCVSEKQVVDGEGMSNQICGDCQKAGHQVYVSERNPASDYRHLRFHGGSLLGRSQTDPGSRDSSQRRSLMDELTQRAQSVRPCICGTTVSQKTDDILPQRRGAPLVKNSVPEPEAYHLSQSSRSSTVNQEYGRFRCSVAFNEGPVGSHPAPRDGAIARRRLESIPVAEVKKQSIPRSASDDSVTRAVTEAVSSKVRALRNMGQIEEAEVKIRVKMGQVSDDTSGKKPGAGKVWKSQDSDDDHTSLSSKQADISDLIARQMVMDNETRKKLLTIAESRKRAETHSNQFDVDRHIQDLLLQDYLSRHPPKTHDEAPIMPQANVNIHIERDAVHTMSDISPESLSARPRYDTKTEKGTITTTDQATNTKATTRGLSETLPINSQPPNVQVSKCNCGTFRTQNQCIEPAVVAQAPPLPSTASHRPVCSCSCKSPSSAVVAQAPPLPSTASHRPVCSCSCKSPSRDGYVIPSSQIPPVCSCKCTSQSPRTFHSSAKTSSYGSPRTFTAEHPGLKSTNFSNKGHCCGDLNVHEILKKRNTAYFLQFSEDESIKTEESEESKKPPLDVVTIKVPKKKFDANKAPISVPKPPLQGGYSVKISSEVNREKYIPIREKCICSPLPAESNGEKCICSPLPVEKSTRAEQISSVRGSQSETTDYSKENRVSYHVSISTRNRDKFFNERPLSGKDTCGEEVQSGTVRGSLESSSDSVDQDRRIKNLHMPGFSSKKNGRALRETDLNVHRSRKRSSGKVFKTMAFHTGSGGSMSSVASGASETQEKTGGRQPDKIGDSHYNRDLSDTGKMPTLQEYLEKNYPEYLNAAEKRRRCIAEMAYLRQLRHQSRKRFIELEGDLWKVRHRQQRRYGPRPKPVQKKRQSPKTMKMTSRQRYRHLPEVQHLKAELKRKEENRTNRLMAEIYTKKLQEKVLKGSTSLRSSVSVISSL